MNIPHSVAPRTLSRILMQAGTLVLLTLAAAWSYTDVKYGFKVLAPPHWAPLRSGVVPGIYRFGWISPQAAKDHSGANIMVFVILKDKQYGASDLLKANVEQASKHGLKVIKQELVQVEGKPGFVMEVTGSGNGMSLLPGAKTTPKGSPKLVPTRQRWLAVVGDTQVVGLMSTCTEAGFPRHQAEFRRAESTLTFKND